ncbi:uncharacterized protein LOC123508099 [Portunus trituberculatus]|uniref:uncharacterized protein LOC123508099 n=1 Tax=Portunus trituberculatus TaxID=210409 RepID=UPI001E1CD913|nr:uncharacterized protein LOC123508099 [Portunus trituberculatus]
MEGVSVAELRCQCRDNASATPYQVIINEQLMKLHVNAQRYGHWYVVAVVTLYLLGVILIVQQDRNIDCTVTATTTALVECVSCCSCSHDDGDSSDDDEEAAIPLAAASRSPLLMVVEEDGNVEGECCSTSV